MKHLIVLLSVLFTSFGFSQDVNDTDFFFPRQHKHQIGIGASEFVKVVFNSDESAYTIDYRYKLNTDYSLRFGVSYFSDNDENASTEAGIKVGIDKNIKLLKKWEFYYGVDILTRYEKFRSSNREAYKIGAGPILGIAYYISPNFSLSIEPLFLIQYNLFVDNDTFGDKTNESFKVGFRKVGLVNLNFHF
ncbi:hypothetical protein [Psychroserpens sp.]|uniref:hypothetical protein n=1 Tax=Psychroserpens sp. TaxID=2020870 RepID=UPI002B2760FC|nr:hypothetical protein [Psychroserpens sp.]